MRRRVGPGLYQTAQALLVYSTYAALYALFVTQYPAITISFSLFKALRPWYVRRAKQEGCLCKHCENFKCYQETLHSLPKLFESVVSPASLDADGAGEDDDGELEIDDWDGRAGLLKLLEFCALRSKSDMVKFVLCDGAFDRAGKQRCINGECDADDCGFGKRIWSKRLRKHVVDGYGNLKPNVPVEFSSQVKWKRIRSSNKTAPGEAKQPNYEVKTGTVIEFLDEFERDTMRKFPHHRFTILRQKAMASEFERNRWPGWVQSDIDFAMDGDIPPPQGRAIQSEHWSPMGYTLFIQVVSWLDTAAWKDRVSPLPKGAAVTVEPAELSKPDTTQPAAGSFWAEIVSLPSVSAASPDDPGRHLYGVRRYAAAEDAIEYVERRFLRHRKLHTKAFVHISDDKTHDSHAAQTFLKKTFDYLDEHYVKTGKEKFIAWHFHSDNAPSHFKSTKTMYFLTTLPARLASWAAHVSTTFRIFWEFGAPGHGKGVWDGIGAWIKRTVRQDIVDDRPPQRPTIKTASGFIRWPIEVAEHIKARLNTDEYIQSHLKATINEVVVTYTATAEIVRPKPDHEYAAMPGIKKTFLFMPVRESVVLERKFACWCTACMHASAPGEGLELKDAAYICKGCTSGLPWKETSVERTDAAGVANGRQKALVHARELAGQLQRKLDSCNQPVWVAVQNRGELDPDQYWIGRATSYKMHEEAGSVTGSVGRVRYDKGDLEITVEWYSRDISGGDERRIFKRWARDERTGDPGPEVTTTSNPKSPCALADLMLCLLAGEQDLHLQLHPATFYRCQDAAGTASRRCSA